MIDCKYGFKHWDGDDCAICNRDKRIAELEQQLAELKISEETLLRANDLMVAKNREKNAQLAELREVTKELADDVEAYADVDRHGRFAYPHIMAKWERDMEPVNRARALLKQGGEG